MTGSFFLDWATLAVSLFNTVLLLWLGLTVLLNADPQSRGRRWGVWLAGGGLLLGGLFFVSHSAILGLGPNYWGTSINFWWQVGWMPVALLPFAWYVIILWYAGFWDDRLAPLRRRHRPWFYLAWLLTAGLVGLLVFSNALPSFWQLVKFNRPGALSAGGIPLLLLAYPLYILLCIGLSLDALRRPGPSTRVMGDLARRRARPWLMAASVALLAASLLVTLVMWWVASNVRQGWLYRTYASVAFGVAWFDLLIASFIAAAVLLLGQAVVSYEVFTGKTLPRRGFAQHWRRAVLLAAGYGVVMSGSLTLQLRPIYSLLLTAMLMVAFYALLSWRSFAERERAMQQLRPFVASQRLYERLLTPVMPAHLDVATPFRALCEEILGTRVAVLAAVGPLAPLVGPALMYPDDRAAPPPPVADIAARFDSPQAMCAPLDPARYGGAVWAVPLWSERGLIGVLLLGEKRDGGLYTQEEMEIARASGERLIDALAGAEMARRLMALQRERLAQGQVLDRRTRRVLHDDVLPRLHTAMLTLSADGASPDAVASLADVHRRIADLLREMPATTAPEVARLGLVGALRRSVDEELASAFDEVAWQVEPEAEQKTRDIPPLTAEVLFHAAREAIRNAARHGRQGDTERPLHLRVGVSWGKGLQVAVEDDGVGMGAQPVGESGGQGLALHSTMMAIVGGTLTVDSIPGASTCVTLALPEGAW